MIRRATMDDVADLVLFCFDCQADMHWKDHGLIGDRPSVMRTLMGMIQSPEADVFVVELGGELAGACALSLQGFAWNPGVTVASEMIWHMAPSFPAGPAKNRWLLRMLEVMQAWAKWKGAKVFKANTRHGDLALGKSLEKRGMKPFETVYLWEVANGN